MQPLARQRLLPLDWMRGLVMILMTLDHVSGIFNSGKIAEDAFADGSAMAPLFHSGANPLQFLTRWVTHLCAPTFVFLAGTALALSVAARLRRGDSGLAVDRHLIARGLLLILLEVWMSLSSFFPVLEVIYAIGAALICMVLLRRLPSWALVGLALAWIVGGELATDAMGLKPLLVPGEPHFAPLWGGLLFMKGLVHLPFELPGFLTLPSTDVFVALYSFVPWLAIMMLGWGFGQWLDARRQEPELGRKAARLLGVCGALGLLVFLLQRLLDGYGNFWLPRGDDTWWRWLQVSKYPPSLAFCGLELGLMALLLAAFFRFQPVAPRRNGPLLVFGQVALFFFLVHVHLLMLVRYAWDQFEGPPPLALGGTWLGTLLALAVLYPICLGYRRIKQAYPESMLRFF